MNKREKVNELIRIMKKIKEKRKELNNSYMDNQVDKETQLKVSQDMDKLINAYYKLIRNKKEKSS